MKIALIQLNPVIGDFHRNCETIRHGAEQAKAAGCALAVFPELAISGYPPQDLLERPAFLADHDRALEQLLASIRGIGIVCGAVTRHTGTTGKPLHNSAILFENGEILAAAHKRLLPTYDVFDEARYFEPAATSQTITYQGFRLGLTICEDIWNDSELFPRPLYAAAPAAELAASGLDLLINIAASPFHQGKQRLRREIFANLCARHHLPLLYVNQVGGQDSLVFDGGSLAMNATGTVIAQARHFAEDMVVIDTDAWQGEMHEERAGADEVAEVCQALILGTRDYVTKCGFQKVVIGLSGGIDSALTAAIAAQALGRENVLGIAMPSPYTAPESIEDAETLAKNFGIAFTVIPISPLVDAYQTTLAPLFAGRPADVTEQNIQARIRGNLLMAIANKEGRLVLSTGNKSEMAVGYCTLYGDMSGGLAMLADVPKMLVYELARYLNREGVVIPQRTIDRAPTAELKPDQRDEDDLPPYPVLDQILALYLEEHKPVAEIIALGFDPAVVQDVVRRIRINEYKRKQAPPGLKVTSKAFGYGRRYPTAERYLEGA
ncbi:MAG TPA: NAD+ synthase [Desulfurivibrionaceae bacterium]|nr:NAD+ synthase [Desulfurivibrionaceae bacterium]